MVKSEKILADSIDTLIEQNEHLVKELIKLRAACDAVDEENENLRKEVNRLKYQVACFETAGRSPRYYDALVEDAPIYHSEPKYWSVEGGLQF